MGASSTAMPHLVAPCFERTPELSMLKSYFVKKIQNFTERFKSVASPSSCTSESLR